MATSSKSNNTTTNTQWLSSIRKNGLKMGICLLDKDGEVVTTIPIPSNLVVGIQKAGVNLAPISKYMAKTYPATERTTSLRRAG